MNVALRTWKREDIPRLVTLANDFEVSRSLRDTFPYPYTKKDAEAWVSSNLDIDPPANFAIVVDGMLAGGAAIIFKTDIYRYNAEIGYWLGRPYWGRGIMTEAVRLLIADIFSAYNLVRIYAEVFSNNPASMKVLAKNGFRQEAILKKSIVKYNEVMDVHIWAKYTSS